METFNELVTDYQSLSKDSSAANVTLGKSLINRFIRRILTARDWAFNRDSYTDESVEDQQNYPLPKNCWRVRQVKVTVGDLNYFPIEVTSRQIWTNLNRTVVTSDSAQRFFVENDHIELYPVPATTGNDIVIYFQKLVKTLSADDYTTGTITITTPSPLVTTVTVSSPATWTAAMVGRHIKPTTDGFYYEISAITTTTPQTATVKREFTAPITDGAYTITELIPLPFGFQDIPLWGALAIYWRKQEDIAQAREYKEMYKEELLELLRRDAKSTGNVLEKSDLEEFEGLIDINKWPQSMS